jgi:Uma2 family endonuclease
MAGDAAARRMMVEEYLAFEASATERHEFLDGQMFAMTGGTAAHGELIVAVGAELRTALRSSPCRAYDSNLRVKSTVTGLYTYPDVSIACGGAQFEGDSRTTLLSPRVVIEVLSPSTEAYDRGEKFAHFRTVASLAEYVLVSTSHRRIEVFTRRDDVWELRVYGEGSQAELGSVGLELAVDAVYEGVELEATPTPAG